MAQRYKLPRVGFPRRNRRLVLVILTIAVFVVPICIVLISWIRRNLDPASAMRGQTNLEMTFYGKALDQDGQPLPDIGFEFLLEAYPRNWTFATRDRPYEMRRYFAQSDARGEFQFNLTGSMLTLLDARHPGYRQLEELDGGEGKDGENTYTKKIGLISWGEQLYMSDPAYPAVFVFIKDGRHQTSALPSKGGRHQYNRWWVEYKPAWPRKPSLADVDWIDGPRRINVRVPLVIKVVDADGRPMPELDLVLTVERYRSIEEINRDHYQSKARTAKSNLTLRTDDQGIARGAVEGFRLLELLAMEAGIKWNTGPVQVGGISYYARDFTNKAGESIFYCDETNPIQLVLIARDAKECHAAPCRGGYEMHDGQWRKVEAVWPDFRIGQIAYRPSASTQPVTPGRE